MANINTATMKGDLNTLTIGGTIDASQNIKAKVILGGSGGGGELEPRVAALEEQVIVINQNMSSLQDDIDTINRDVSALTDRVLINETDINVLNVDVADLKSASEELTTRVTVAEQALGALQLEVTALSTRLDIDEETITALQQKVEALQNILGNILRDITDLQRRMGNLELGFGVLSGQIQDLVLDKADKIYSNSIIDLSAFVKGRIDNGVIGYAEGTTLIEKQGYNFLIVTNTAYRGAVSGLTPVISNTTYNYSFAVNGTLNTSQIHYYDGSGNYMSYTNIYNQQGNVTIPSNAKYIRWAFLLGPAQTCLITSFVLSQDNSLIPAVKDLYISKTDNEIVSDVWNSNTTYAVGSYCIYSNALWKCLTQNKGVIPTEGSNWTKTSLTNELKAVNNSNDLTLDFSVFGSNITVNEKNVIHNACNTYFSVIATPEESVIITGGVTYTIGNFAKYRPLAETRMYGVAIDNSDNSSIMIEIRILANGNLNVYSRKTIQCKQFRLFNTFIA